MASRSVMEWPAIMVLFPLDRRVSKYLAVLPQGMTPVPGKPLRVKVLVAELDRMTTAVLVPPSPLSQPLVATLAPLIPAMTVRLLTQQELEKAILPLCLGALATVVTEMLHPVFEVMFGISALKLPPMHLILRFSPLLTVPTSLRLKFRQLLPLLPHLNGVHLVEALMASALLPMSVHLPELLIPLIPVLLESSEVVLELEAVPDEL